MIKRHMDKSVYTGTILWNIGRKWVKCKMTR